MTFNVVADGHQPAGLQAVEMILTEVGWAAHAGAIAIAKALDECPKAAPGEYMMGAGHGSIEDAARGLAHAATVSRCVFGAVRRSANRREKEFHAERAKRVRQQLDGIDLSPLRGRTVRDSLEHVDEHVDRLCMRRSDAPPRQTILHNIVISSRGAFVGDLVYCRVLIGDEGVFANLQHEVALRPILAALEAVSARLHQAGGSIIQ